METSLEEGTIALETVDDNNENLDSQPSNSKSNTHHKHLIEQKQLSSGIEEVRRRALTGALRASPLRSIAWAILLELLPSDSTKWLPLIRMQRKKYSLLKSKLEYDPRCGQQDNPLSQEDESMWNQHFRDAELQTTIKLDVVRTFPGVEFFKQPEIQQAMASILFCFARETPSLIYRQGMHEILAPLLFVIQSDQKAASCCDIGEELEEIMDPQFLEHDCYYLFKKIMSAIESFYRIRDYPINMSHSSLDSKFSDNTLDSSKVEMDVGHHLESIRKELLVIHDRELDGHLQKCDISLTLFGIRWLRVLFGREFPLQDLLILWDAIFAEEDIFEFTRYVMVSMLIAIRAPLLQNDTMVCLTYLMHYPTTIDVQYIIDYALYLKYPNNYSKPISNMFYENKQTSEKSLQETVKNQAKKREIVVEVKKPSNNLKVATSVNDDSISDGYLILERDALREELMHAHNVMSLCKLKLEQYGEVLKDALPVNLIPTHPAYQALGGIKELCTLLQTRQNLTSEIEPAFEANEAPNNQNKKKLNNPKPPPPSKINKRKVNEHSKPKPNVDFTKELNLIKIEISTNNQVPGAPSYDPLGIRKD